jgi:hypothetical protein
MESKKESDILLKNGAKKHVSRDTVLIRIDRGLREALKELSRESKKTMSKIVDFAVSVYLRSVKRTKV